MSSDMEMRMQDQIEGAQQTYIQMDEEINRLRSTLQGIADADWRKWQELASPEEFVRWAKCRAAHALSGGE